jgi:hypothetical protein
MTSNIQITGLPMVALKDVVCLLVKEECQDQFITVKAVMYIAVFIHVSNFITQNCITENLFWK